MPESGVLLLSGSVSRRCAVLCSFAGSASIGGRGPCFQPRLLRVPGSPVPAHRRASGGFQIAAKRVPGDTQRYRIRAVERALDVLAAFSADEPELTLTELSSRLNLSASTTYRLLVTLERRRYVERNSQTGGYTLGVACLDLGTVFLSQLDLRDRVLPVLKTLRQEFRETVHLAVLDRSQMEVIYLEKLEGLLPIGLMGSRVGGRAPAHCTGLGKCLLAYMADPVVRELYATSGMRALTPNTITDVEELLLEMAKIRELGYAVDDVEHEPDVKCVAAPVWNHRQTVVGAISVTGPEQRMNRLIEEGHLIESVLEAAQNASARMGYSREAPRE
jgi:IclR family KDG regulon transcriptional repressor